MNYSIRAGDTLSALAQRFNTSVGALMKANSSTVKNANLIYTGNSLNIPGKKDDFQPASARRAGPSLDGSSRTSGPGSSSGSPSGGSSALDAARSVLGTNTQALKGQGPVGKFLDPSVSDHVCCANFVSACLQASGQISNSMHDNSVAGLASKLAGDSKWSSTSLANAKPGDVVCFNVPGEGSMSHVEMFAGFKNGQPQFIGSNNVNSDGSQRISEGYAGYPIGAIYHYNG